MRYLLAMLLVCALAAPALAAFQGPGTGAGVTTVSQIQNARDDARVVLEGVILEKKGDEKYLFKDDTGTVIVEIDDKVFAGRQVTPQTRVRITGKLDKELLGKDEIDVKTLDIL